MSVALFCGQSSYPRSDSAAINRYRALAEMTCGLGHEVIFVNRFPCLRVDDPPMPPAQYQVIHVSGPYRLENGFARRLKTLFAVPREIRAMKRIKDARKITMINVYTEFWYNLVFYHFAARWLGAKCIVHVVEHRSHIAGRSLKTRLNDRLFETLITLFPDKYIAISSLTRNMILAKNPHSDVIIIPPVCRFDAFDRIEPFTPEKPYFLYCASLAYEDVAWFVIEAYLRLQTSAVELVLVLSGRLSDRIKKVCEENPAIRLFSGLEYQDLLAKYKGAHALLIPLRNIPQDAARYPQKMSEYLASRRPVISCKVGDVAEHFTNGTNAFLAESYDVEEYAQLMRLSLSDMTATIEIAREGHKLGFKLFDVRAQEQKLGAFLK